MIATLCFQFAGYVYGTKAFKNLESNIISDDLFFKYANIYGAKSVVGYLDQAPSDDGFVCAVAYLNFYFPDVEKDSERAEKIIESMKDGEELATQIKADHSWFYDVRFDSDERMKK